MTEASLKISELKYNKQKLRQSDIGDFCYELIHYLASPKRKLDAELIC